MIKPATTISKVCQVLEALRTRPAMGVTELANSVGLLPSDVHRILRSLALYNFVEQDPQTKMYRLGLELLRLGYVVHSRLELRHLARPILKELTEAAEATASMAVFDPHQQEIVFVEQIDSPRDVMVKFRIGSRASPHATAVGKVLAAFMPPETVEKILLRSRLPRRTARTITDREVLKREYENIRARGYSTDRGESVDGAACVGAPVRNESGEVVAAISVSLLSARLGRSNEARLIAQVKRAAAEISERLGYDGAEKEAAGKNGNRSHRG
jgi:IclR family KDG regulon transcriptional repressor